MDVLGKKEEEIRKPGGTGLVGLDKKEMVNMPYTNYSEFEGRLEAVLQQKNIEPGSRYNISGSVQKGYTFKFKDKTGKLHQWYIDSSGKSTQMQPDNDGNSMFVRN